MDSLTPSYEAFIFKMIYDTFILKYYVYNHFQRLYTLDEILIYAIYMLNIL